MDAYLALAGEHGIDPVHLALAFGPSRSFITLKIIGATKMEQLDACLASSDVKITPRYRGGDRRRASSSSKPNTLIERGQIGG